MHHIMAEHKPTSRYGCWL